MKIAIVNLKCFGHLHPGSERWKRVTKRCVDYIPGSTLYGNVADALIRLDCKKSPAEPGKCYECLKDSVECGYIDLLEEVKNKRIRFSPLISTVKEIEKAQDFNEVALTCFTKKTITPHAPINRSTGKVHEDLLHGVIAHLPFQRYSGFVVAEEGFIKKHLRRALRLMPLSPLGGRGKFTQAEAVVVSVLGKEAFLKNLPFSSEFKLLTPAAFDNGTLDFLKEAEYELRAGYYRVWRTGVYWNGNGYELYESFSKEKRQRTSPLTLKGGTRIRKDNLSLNELKESFLWGIGNQDWTYLGWGQILIEKEG